MNSIFQYFKYVTDIPAFLALFGEIKNAAKVKSEASIDLVIEDALPIVAKYAPNIPASELNAIAGDLIALVSLGGDHSLKHSESVALVIVQSLPKFGLKLTQEHADALVKAVSDALGDFE